MLCEAPTKAASPRGVRSARGRAAKPHLDLVRHTDTPANTGFSRARPEPTGRCRECGRSTYCGAEFCKCRQCPHYAPIWAKDQQRKAFENMAAYDDGDGMAIMITITAPGRGELPWDEDFCKALGPHRHGGDLGCRVVPDIARAWNASAPGRWRRLHDCAARATARRTGHRPHLLMRAWEEQIRGVLHVHASIARGRGIDKLASDVYGEELRRYAPEYGFGTIDTPTGGAWTARQSAAYFSSYITKGSGKKRELCKTVMSDQLPKSIVHTSTKLTMRTHVTMRTLRFRRLVWMRWRCVLPWQEQHCVESVTKAFDAELVGTYDQRGPP